MHFAGISKDCSYSILANGEENKLSKGTFPLKLNRVSDKTIQVPNDATAVLDLLYTFKTTKVWSSVDNKYRIFNLRCADVWVKQDNGTFKMVRWPDEFLKELIEAKVVKSTANLLVMKPKSTKQRELVSYKVSAKKNEVWLQKVEAEINDQERA